MHPPLNVFEPQLCHLEQNTEPKLSRQSRICVYNRWQEEMFNMLKVILLQLVRERLTHFINYHVLCKINVL